MDLYMHPGSPPCMAVLLAEKSIGVNLNKKFVDVVAQANLKEDYLKMNPQHTVPTLNDNGFVLWESKAILLYLNEKYGKDKSLYPEDLATRTLINQRLYFDIGTMYPKLTTYWETKFVYKEPINPKLFESMGTTMEFLDKFLENSKYAAGDHLTLADFPLLVSVICYEMAKIDISKYPNVAKWFKMLKDTLPGYLDIQEGINDLANYF